MRQLERRKEKLSVLSNIYADLEDKLKRAGLIRVNEIWEGFINIDKVWSSRAYFLQDFKKYSPKYFSVHMSQRGGTFVKMVGKKLKRK